MIALRSVIQRGKESQRRLQRTLHESAANLGVVLGELAPRAAARKPLRSCEAALLRAADAVAADNPAGAADALAAAAQWWRRACELAPRAANSPGAAEVAAQWDRWAASLQTMSRRRRTLRGRWRLFLAGLRGGRAVDAAARWVRGANADGKDSGAR